MNPSTLSSKLQAVHARCNTELAQKTKIYLDEFPQALPASSELIKQIHRQKLTRLREGWTELHQFLKPATDADTLKTPFSLLLAYYQKFQQLSGFQAVRFSVFHLNEVNYLQVRASWIAELAQKLATIIPGAPPFPVSPGR